MSTASQTHVICVTTVTIPVHIRRKATWGHTSDHTEYESAVASQGNTRICICRWTKEAPARSKLQSIRHRRANVQEKGTFAQNLAD
jgi:hypothetical protein